MSSEFNKPLAGGLSVAIVDAIFDMVDMSGSDPAPKCKFKHPTQTQTNQTKKVYYFYDKHTKSCSALICWSGTHHWLHHFKCPVYLWNNFLCSFLSVAHFSTSKIQSTLNSNSKIANEDIGTKSST